MARVMRPPPPISDGIAAWSAAAAVEATEASSSTATVATQIVAPAPADAARTTPTGPAYDFGAAWTMTTDRGSVPSGSCR